MNWGGHSGSTGIDGTSVLTGGSREVWQYPLSTAYDASTIGTPYTLDIYALLSGSGAAALTTHYLPEFSKDGTKLITKFQDSGTYYICVFSLSTPFVISSAASTVTTTAHSGDVLDMFFTPNGDYLIDSGPNTGDGAWAKPTPFDASSGSTTTATYTLSGSLNVPGGGGFGNNHARTGVACDATGTQWLGAYYNNSIADYALVYGTASTPFDRDTITFDTSRVFALPARSVAVKQICFDPTLTKVLVGGGGSGGPLYSYDIPSIGKPTQRWGRQLGRSPFDGTALRNTGIITTTEAYQLQL
jgi:WD40 repeat protein